MSISLGSILADVEAGLKALPGITAAVQGIKAVGASKETTLQKVGQIIEISAAAGAAVGSTIPNPQIQQVSNLVNQIIEEVFAAPAQPAP